MFMKLIGDYKPACINQDMYPIVESVVAVSSSEPVVAVRSDEPVVAVSSNEYLNFAGLIFAWFYFRG